MKNVVLACILGVLLTTTVSLTLWAAALHSKTAKSCVMPVIPERPAQEIYPSSQSRIEFAQIIWD